MMAVALLRTVEWIGLVALLVCVIMVGLVGVWLDSGRKGGGGHNGA